MMELISKNWHWIGVHVAFPAGLAFFAVMFAMNVGVILTWVDRRYGALLQDRIGPNRAAVWVPKRLVQGAALLLGLGLAGAVGAFAALGPNAATRGSWMLLVGQLAIFLAWMTLLVVAARGAGQTSPMTIERLVGGGDPRSYFYGGLVAHVALFIVAYVVRGAAVGTTDALFYGVVALFVASALGGGVYTVAAIERGADRLVPIRLAGLLHPAADGLKTIFKEDFVPPNADKLMHGLAPFISFFPTLVLLAVVPFGPPLCFATAPDGLPDLSQLAASLPADGRCSGSLVPLQTLSVNVGILYYFAMAGTGIVGAALAGWASDNKFSLLGGLRAASQMVSYEVTLGLTVVGAMMLYGTVRLDEMVTWQAQNAWGLFVQPFAFVLFFAAAIAETKRIPFDLPEGESEIVAGYFTEYSGMKFAMFFFSEYVAVAASSTLMVVLFLGGWHVPFVDPDGIRVAIGDTTYLALPLSHGVVAVLGVLFFIKKVVLVCVLNLTIRWTLPRFRYDQLMRLGWRVLLPASLINVLLTGIVVLLAESAGPPVLASLRVLGQVSMAVVVVSLVAFVVWLVGFLLEPKVKRRHVASSAARIAEQLGGTPRAPMGA